MSWAWKDKDKEKNTELNLLYEPGNWGDVLKGTWLAILARHIEIKCYVDPHAGAKDYPLLEPVKERLGYSQLYAEVAVQEGRLLSSASVVRRLTGCRCELNEPDPSRRATWDIPCDDQDGRDFLKKIQAVKTATDLVLWDPYDFFEKWSHIIGDLLQLKCPVLIYLYNKSPRGVTQARQYESLRKRLPNPWCGRIPSDGLLPRAYHEMILLNGPPTAKQELKDATIELHLQLSKENAFSE